jgi:hypothetical protein
LVFVLENVVELVAIGPVVKIYMVVFTTGQGKHVFGAVEMRILFPIVTNILFTATAVIFMIGRREC